MKQILLVLSISSLFTFATSWHSYDKIPRSGGGNYGPWGARSARVTKRPYYDRGGADLAAWKPAVFPFKPWTRSRSGRGGNRRSWGPPPGHQGWSHWKPEVFPFKPWTRSVGSGGSDDEWAYVSRADALCRVFCGDLYLKYNDGGLLCLTDPGEPVTIARQNACDVLCQDFYYFVIH